MPAETLANAFSHHIRQDSKEGRKQEENAREQGMTTAQKLQERKILEKQEELRRQKEQTKLLLDLKHTTQVLELQVAAVKSVALSTLYAFKHTSPPSCFLCCAATSKVGGIEIGIQSWSVQALSAEEMGTRMHDAARHGHDKDILHLLSAGAAVDFKSVWVMICCVSACVSSVSQDSLFVSCFSCTHV
jgi:hypothetical protein